MLLNIIIYDIDQPRYEFFGIPDIVWLINELFVWHIVYSSTLRLIKSEQSTPLAFNQLHHCLSQCLFSRVKV